ncbi:MAG: type II CRISPR-associated endonuclease Cas1 [Flavobacteriales bacterium]|nr:type II CRISPR-associated endonuclease Cas1 [Flavobacteriales bacterium]
MIKRTLYFGNPAWLNVDHGQLVIRDPLLKGMTLNDEKARVPIEDIGLVVLDHQQITVTHTVLHQLLANNVAVVVCDERRHPCGMLLNLEGNRVQAELFKYQIESSEPLRKQLWKQTVESKIQNQAAVLANAKGDAGFLLELANKVQSGDSGNREAQAAAWYWPRLFRTMPDFRRFREGPPPNNLLNYGYAILRAMVARSLVGSGLLPTLGIFHRNRYNAYALADDIMEPYRPFVDTLVLDIIAKTGVPEDLTLEHKSELLKLPVADVILDSKASPLMAAVARTTASLAQCFAGEQRKMLYPVLP